MALWSSEVQGTGFAKLCFLDPKIVTEPSLASLTHLLTLGCSEGKYSVYLPSKESRQLMLKIAKLSMAFWGFKASVRGESLRVGDQLLVLFLIGRW